MLLLLLLILSLSSGVGAKPPHIIFMVADDLGWNDIGFNNPDIISPHIDKLAATGVILNQSYVQPLCSPSRSAFMTGYYPFRLGLQHIVIRAAQQVCAPLDKTFLPQVLKKYGYATHMIGKWHLGFCKWECTPNYRGFDSYFGYYNSWEDYYTKVTGHNGFDFHKNRELYWDANGTYSTYLYGNVMEHTLRTHDPDVPLFLYFPMQSVHEPLQVPQTYYDMYPNIIDKGRRTFSGMVTALDDVVGRMVSVLQDTDMYKDTIIFFSADNGGWVPYHGNNYPLRGGKITIWEGGTRVPAFIHSPLLSKTGVRYDGLIHAVDWFPTIVEAAGVSYQDSSSDGVSQWKSIVTLSESSRTEFVYNLDNHSMPVQGHAAIRVGNYKLIKGMPGLYNDWYKPDVAVRDPIPQSDYSDLYELANKTLAMEDWHLFKGLYNIKEDPYEHTNLYHDLPDIVKQLEQRMSYYYTKMVPANYPQDDKKSYPQYRGGAWTPGWC